MRVVRLRKRARALAISWPPYAGKRCTTAADGRYHLRVIARDVAGNTRALDAGDVTARGVVLSLPDRSITAGRRLRVGISADARGLRLDLARLGAAAPAVLARKTHAPAAVARLPAALPGGVYVVSTRHAGRTYRTLLAVRGAQHARVALVVATRPDEAALPFQRRLDALGIRFDVLTQRDVEEHALLGYTAIVAPPFDPSRAIIVTGGVKLVHTLAGITPGLGS